MSSFRLMGTVTNIVAARTPSIPAPQARPGSGGCGLISEPMASVMEVASATGPIELKYLAALAGSSSH